ncbi:MAG: leucine-rich repeat domain-containing protein, partial [Clostridia bacterium]|nr:leucine-rich repeat domain-containing protein [Clostridia bacterium]
GVTSIGDHAFDECSSLTSVTVPGSVTSIGKSVFNGCASLTSLTIGNGVTSIGDGAFEGCGNLERINIASIASWCAVSFEDCTANPFAVGSTYDKLYVDDKLVHDLVIPGGVTAIGDYAFCYCEGLTSVSVSGSVTSIGKYAFYR